MPLRPRCSITSAWCCPNACAATSRNCRCSPRATEPGQECSGDFFTKPLFRPDHPLNSAQVGVEICMQRTIVTRPAETQGLRHDTTTIVLHWMSAALVVALWTIGQTVDVFPNGPLRIDYRSIHIILGIVLGVVLLARLSWRLMRRETLPPIDHGVLLTIARVTHWALYVLLIAAAGLGIANVWVRGDSIFNLFRVPTYDPGNRPLMHL